MSFNLQLLQITLQALSSFAIAGGLIFTAVQFAQARKAQLVANFSKLVELQYELRKIRVEQPSLASVHSQDVEHLHSEREIQEYFLNLMQLSLYEIAWYAHKHGQLPDDYFRSWTRRRRRPPRRRRAITARASPSVGLGRRRVPWTSPDCWDRIRA
jgi:hypothetical protein